MSKRELRRSDEVRILDSLARSSPVFEYQADDATEHVVMIFHGSGVARADTDGQHMRADTHRVRIEFPQGYPEDPPNLRFETELFHPNVAMGGFVSVTDLGILWRGSLTIDVVAERLWDTIRGAYFEASSPANSSALHWYARNRDLLPVDVRRIDTDPQHNTNIVCYRRRGHGEKKMGARPIQLGNQQIASPRSAALSKSQPAAADRRPPVQGRDGGIVFLDE